MLLSIIRNVLMEKNIMTYCFFGHRDTSASVAPQLEQTLRKIIEADASARFLVGHQGCFDRIVASLLATLKSEFPQIRCYIVLYRMPEKTNEVYPLETLYPEELASVPKRFGIDKRNRWMLKQSDAVIAYVISSVGNSARYLSIAEKGKKICINLAKNAVLDQMLKKTSLIL